MKRILVFILCILYMASATGATLHLHYCMGELMSAGFTHSDEDQCGKCGMKKKNSKGCCKDEHKTFKTSDHNLAKATFTHVFQLAAVLSATHYFSQIIPVSEAAALTAAPTHAPPDIGGKVPLYLRVRNLRI